MESHAFEQYVLEQYDLNKSTYEIAEALKTYPNKIRRILSKHGKARRTKSEAQTKALETGRHEHPTKGKSRSESTKIKISNSVAEAWKNISEEEKEKRSSEARERWDNLTEDDKKEFHKMAAIAVRESAKNGSKLEKFLLLELSRKGHTVEFHREHLVFNEKLQMDLFLPLLNIVIEVDGPAHFFPIWGEESLAKRLASDQQKNGLLMQAGFTVIRVKHLIKTISEIHKRNVLTKILSVLESIEAKTLTDTLIEIEVK